MKYLARWVSGGFITLCALLDLVGDTPWNLMALVSMAMLWDLAYADAVFGNG